MFYLCVGNCDKQYSLELSLCRSPIEFSSHAQSLGGPAMMIVNLKKVDPTTKKRWRKDRLREVAFEWRSLLALNGIKADAYDIGSEDSAPTILLSTTVRNYLRFSLTMQMNERQLSSTAGGIFRFRDS